MSPSNSFLNQKQPSQSSHLALTLKLSYCYLTFYIVQMVMAAFLCALLVMDYLQLVAFVQVPIAFFVAIDMILSHFVQNKPKTCGRFQITNIIVLLGSVVTIGLDFSIPHITRNRVHLVFFAIRILRFTMQFIWITKLVIESKRIIDSYQGDIIIQQQEESIDAMDDELAKMTL